MPFLNYTMQLPKGEERRFARAQLYDVDASAKDLCAVCDSIRGKSVAHAEALLKKAGRGELPIWFRKHSKRLGHRSELGGRKGRYPKKSAKIVLQVLRNAVANANSRGLLGELKVVHASANKQAIYRRAAPRGRWRWNNYATARIEIVLREMAEAMPEEKEERKKKLEEKAAVKRKAREEARKAEELRAAKGEEKAEAAEEKKELTPEEKAAEKTLERASMVEQK